MPAHRSRSPLQGHHKPKTAELPAENVVALVQPSGEVIPELPNRDEMLDSTAAVWETFWRSNVALAVVESDHYALKRWIEAIDERDRVVSIVRENPTVSGSQGQPVLNPLAKRLDRLETQIERLEGQFGMTAKSRADLGIAAGSAALTADKLNQMATSGEGAGDTDDGEDAASAPDGFVDVDP